MATLAPHQSRMQSIMQCSMTQRRRRRGHHAATALTCMLDQRRPDQSLSAKTSTDIRPVLDGPVSLCVCHKLVLYRHFYMDRVAFWHGGFLRSILHYVKRKFWYFLAPKQGYFPLKLCSKLWLFKKNFPMARRSSQLVQLSRLRWTLIEGLNRRPSRLYYALLGCNDG